MRHAGGDGCSRHGLIFSYTEAATGGVDLWPGSIFNCPMLLAGQRLIGVPLGRPVQRVGLHIEGWMVVMILAVRGRSVLRRNRLLVVRRLPRERGEHAAARDGQTHAKNESEFGRSVVCGAVRRHPAPFRNRFARPGSRISTGQSPADLKSSTLAAD